jgi:hypothetical protein
VEELMRIRSNKLPFFQKGMRARNLILSTLWRGLSPREVRETFAGSSGAHPHIELYENGKLSDIRNLIGGI